MDKLEKTDKMMFDKLEALHCLNKWEVLFIIWYCNFYLHLDFIKSKAREREARENGAGVTHSGSTEDTMMEAKFTRRIGPLLCPGRQARLLLPQTEPRPSNFVNTINIVVKLLDQTMFPVQARYLNEMIRDLGQLNLFNQIIGRNRNIIIREFNGQELRFDPPSNVGDLVHKDICIL
ncbi:hypothetical protein RhiirA5_410884 [Rhizophagus irregularis]|uniref:Uncharacterized protein n=1 Tax=Rhizophagus irregularis TaxID=588596 RepID=A0A2I1EDH5_9GLOM|nr:hypothetical protein RhiirA5_410884 [Rhizophagus irregularis]PKY20186.1 hypothetical protein RhiirB3_433422 [Rhizophagus irregularis]